MLPIGPQAAVTMLYSDQPQYYKEFWDEMSIDDLHAVYDALSPKVLEMIEEPTIILESRPCTRHSERVSMTIYWQAEPS